FPGNIRELKGMVEDVVAKSTNNMITINDFNENLKHLDYDSRQESEHIRQNHHNYQADIQSWEQLPDLETTRDLLIHEALRRAGNNQSLAAKILGVTRQNLNQCLKRKNEHVNIK
ncbi:MAG: helix-turn-helix domain-containing protein, partial [Lentisphaeria bacterium]